jgi:hypothetical protein
MKTTVDVFIRYFFNPAGADSIMIHTSFESIVREIIPAAFQDSFEASIDAAQASEVRFSFRHSDSGLLQV